MTLWTLAEITTKINNDLDLTDEVMISSAEKTAYINQAIDEAEQIIHSKCEDYLLQKETLALVSGTSEYSFPSNIYAHKIRKVIYDNGSESYEIKRVKNLSLIPDIETSDDYRYVVYTNSSGVPKMILYPASRETNSTYVTIWFIGNANRLTLTTDSMNIPEAVQFVIARTKLECARKEGHPAQMALETEVERQRALLEDVLSTIVPDEDNKISLDLSYYDDSECFG